MGPKIDDFRYMFGPIFCHFLCLILFLTRQITVLPRRKRQQQQKKRQAKATREKTQDQTSPRQDQTDRTEQRKINQQI